MTHRPDEWAGLRFLAGRVCLDFVNSIEDRTGDAPDDFIASYADLVQWGRQRALLTDRVAERLLTLAARDMAAAARALETALTLRAALHGIFQALAKTGEPDAGDLAHLQRAYTDAVAHACLQHGEGRFVWQCPSQADALDQMMWPIAFDATELLTVGDVGRIKVCANPSGCGWLFYDGSKNGSRRWCSMEGCGSQVKMRRLYAKRKAAALSS